MEIKSLFIFREGKFQSKTKKNRCNSMGKRVYYVRGLVL